MFGEPTADVVSDEVDEIIEIESDTTSRSWMEPAASVIAIGPVMEVGAIVSVSMKLAKESLELNRHGFALWR